MCQLWEGPVVHQETESVFDGLGRLAHEAARKARL